MKQPNDILLAQAGLRLSIGALLDGYPEAVKDGRTGAWLKAVLAIAEWYAHIESSGLGRPPIPASVIELKTGLPSPVELAPLPMMALSESFGDPETLFNSRDWLKSAIEAKGAKVNGGGAGLGQCDLDFTLDGCKFNVSLRPILPP